MTKSIFSVYNQALFYICITRSHFFPPEVNLLNIEFKVIMLTHSPFVCSGEKSRHFLLYQHPHLDILQGSCQICVL